jgi:hypothetical protein
MAHRSDRHDHGFGILAGSLLVIVAALVLTVLAGSFGRTHTINQDAEPIWTSATWAK